MHCVIRVFLIIFTYILDRTGISCNSLHACFVSRKPFSPFHPSVLTVSVCVAREAWSTHRGHDFGGGVVVVIVVVVRVITLLVSER